MSYEGMRIINSSEEIMDENSLNGAQNIGVGQNRNNPAANDKIDDANGNQNNVPQYTIPGILHFIEHEWQRFQAERSQWDTDRAELQVSHVRGLPMNWVIHRLTFAIAPDEEKHRKSIFSFTAFGREHFFRSLFLFILLSRPFIAISFTLSWISCFCWWWWWLPSSICDENYSAIWCDATRQEEESGNVESFLFLSLCHHSFAAQVTLAIFTRFCFQVDDFYLKIIDCLEFQLAIIIVFN